MVQGFSIILTTTDDKEVVDQIINKLLTTNLAACVQVDDMVSYFRWEGQIVSQKE